MKRLSARCISLLLVLTLAFSWGGGMVHASADGSILDETIELIRKHYVNRMPEAEIDALAADAILRSLGDKYSEYLSPEQLREFRSELQGSFGGIGVVIRRAGGKIVAGAVLPGTPAEESGIRVGDVIVEVDGVPLADVTVQQAGDLIRGDAGTEVKLRIHRPLKAPEGASEYEEMEVTVTRAVIHRASVSHEILEDADPRLGPVGLIRISLFQEGTSKEFEKAYDELAKEGMKGLILDLRDNLGGLLDECLGVAEKLLPPGPLVYVAEQGSRKKAYLDDSPQDPIGLCVLVNEMTASGSEIVAGAVQDRGIGVLVGTRTFGKGTVQTIFPLSNGGGIKLTTARYYTPMGKSIEGTGIVPDVTVERGAPELTVVMTGKYLRPSGELKLGVAGDDVVDLQMALRKLGYYEGGVDGRFGLNTLEAVRRFQGDAGLAQMNPWDSVGTSTLEALRERISLAQAEASQDKQMEKAKEMIQDMLKGSPDAG